MLMHQIRARRRDRVREGMERKGGNVYFSEVVMLALVDGRAVSISALWSSCSMHVSIAAAVSTVSLLTRWLTVDAFGQRQASKCCHDVQATWLSCSLERNSLFLSLLGFGCNFYVQ